MHLLALGGGLIFDTGTLSAPGGGATEYGFEALTTAPPNPRRIRFNNASAANTTALYIYNITAGRNDIRLILLDLPVGALLYVQDKNTSANFAKFFVSAPTIDRTTYMEVPVTANSYAGAIPNDGRALLYVSGGSRRGVTDGSNAAAGMVGEVLSASNTTGQQLTTLVTVNVATLALTPGDWTLGGVVIFNATSGPNSIIAGISTVPAVLPTDTQVASGAAIMAQVWSSSLTSNKVQTLPTSLFRVNTATAKNCVPRSAGEFRRWLCDCDGLYLSKTNPMTEHV